MAEGITSMSTPSGPDSTESTTRKVSVRASPSPSTKAGKAGEAAVWVASPAAKETVPVVAPSKSASTVGAAPMPSMRQRTTAAEPRASPLLVIVSVGPASPSS